LAADLRGYTQIEAIEKFKKLLNSRFRTQGFRNILII